MDYEHLLETLTKEDKAYLNLIHRWGFTNAEVGETFGVTESRISQKVKEIHRKLRKALKEPMVYVSKLAGNT